MRTASETAFSPLPRTARMVVPTCFAIGIQFPPLAAVTVTRLSWIMTEDTPSMAKSFSARPEPEARSLFPKNAEPSG